MKNSLDLKSYENPTNLKQAKGMVKDLVSEVEKTHEFYKQQMAFLKQQYQIALRHVRPGFIPVGTLAELFDEPEMTEEPQTEPTIDDPEKPKVKKLKKKKRAIPKHLPRTIVEHDLEGKTCPDDGSQLSPMGYDSKEELKYVPAKFEVIEHRYLKYSCSTCKEGVKRKEAEPTLIPRSYASSSLLSHIAVSKFVNHLPLYRQEQIFARDGVHITRQSMADWMIRLGEALNPLVGLMHERILESPVVSADETPVRILTKDGVRTSSGAYMWQLSRWGPNPLIVFEFDPTRKKEVAERLLGHYQGYVQIDGYAGYNILFNENAPRERVGCMAHCLRKFKEYLLVLPKEQRKDHQAKSILELMKKLYTIEDECRSLSYEVRKNRRLDLKAEDIFTALIELVAEEKETVAQSSPYFKALKYAADELPLIKKYLDHGMIELDNNLAENAIRPFALGRRNWLFICSERGAQASANIYSVLITAKANGLEPYAYLKKIIESIPYCETIEDFEVLLPA